MKFTYKSEAELQAMDEKERDTYATQKREFEVDATKDEIEKAVKESKEEIEKELEKSNKRVEEVADEIASLKENNTQENEYKTLKESIKASLIQNKKQIGSLKDNAEAKVTITVKAVQAMTFATNTSGNIGRVQRDSEVYRALRRTPMLLDMVNSSTTNASLFEWVEKTGYEGGVTMVAEGAVKPQGDWDLALFSQKPKKDAIIVTVSKEMLDDIDGMAQDIEDEIYEQIRLFTESAVLNGDGTGNNIVGLNANATPFTAGAFLNTVVSANEFDCLRVAVNQIELNNDFPNYILMHPTDATKMELVKDATTSQYILPPFASVDGTTIKGLPVRTSTLVAQGVAYVGNFNRYKAKTREDIVFTMGYRGAQGDWEKNMVSFLGEQRFFGFIPAVHYGSIVKVDFAVAKALLDPAVA